MAFTAVAVVSTVEVAAVSVAGASMVAVSMVADLMAARGPLLAEVAIKAAAFAVDRGQGTTEWPADRLVARMHRAA